MPKYKYIGNTFRTDKVKLVNGQIYDDLSPELVKQLSGKLELITEKPVKSEVKHGDTEQQ